MQRLLTWPTSRSSDTKQLFAETVLNIGLPLRNKVKPFLLLKLAEISEAIKEDPTLDPLDKDMELNSLFIAV
jgi:hypothetical protein